MKQETQSPEVCSRCGQISLMPLGYCPNCRSEYMREVVFKLRKFVTGINAVLSMDLTQEEKDAVDKLYDQVKAIRFMERYDNKSSKNKS